MNAHCIPCLHVCVECAALCESHTDPPLTRRTLTTVVVTHDAQYYHDQSSKRARQGGALRYVDARHTRDTQDAPCAAPRSVRTVCVYEPEVGAVPKVPIDAYM